MVISAQPYVATTVVQRPTGDHYAILSLVMTLLCWICGGWMSLLCTLPAIVLALAVSNINKCLVMGRGGLGEGEYFTY